MNKKILILCTGNSCRSQMAEGFLRSFGPELEVHSAGINPANIVNPNSLTVMDEVGIDISSHYPKDVSKFINDSFDYVITVCDNAKESCPAFSGNVKHNLHIGFSDPYEASGSDEEVLNEYRKVRDEIRVAFKELYNRDLQDS